MRKLKFFKKELMEIRKTSKLIVLPVVFLFFAILSPLTARYMKEIMEAAGVGEMIKLIPDPVYLDSFIQFFKNADFMCILTTILVFMGSVSEEKSKGSAILVMTKGVSRTDFILSKFFAAALLFTAAYMISAAVFIYYTSILFPGAYIAESWLALFLFWLYGILITAITILASTLSRSVTMSAVMALLAYAVIAGITALPKIGEYSPGILSSLGIEIMKGAEASAKAIAPMIVTVILIFLSLITSVRSFKRQEI